jgi:hypothetical protein
MRLGIISLVACLSVLEPASAQSLKDLSTRLGADWPGFLGPTFDCTSTERGIISWPKDRLLPVWKVEVSEGFSGPTVAKGRLYIFDRVEDTARLRCLEAETGKFLWKLGYPTEYRDKRSIGFGPRCCPVVDDDRVYVFGAEGMLLCARALDGKEIWKIDTEKEYKGLRNYYGVASTPVIEGDLLITQVGRKPPGDGIVAFNKYTGKIVYSIPGEGASYSSPVLATINGRRWCFVLTKENLVGFEPKTGKVDFRFAWSSELQFSANASNPVVVGDQVFVSECYSIGSALLKVKPGGYKVVWHDGDKKPRDKSMMCHWMTPVHEAGYLYGVSGEHTPGSDLRCVELATGKVVWSEPRLSLGSLLKVDGYFVYQTEFGPLLLLKPNPKRYELVSGVEVAEPGADEALLNGRCWAAPVLSRGLMYLRGRKWLVCVELIPQKK